MVNTMAVRSVNVRQKELKRRRVIAPRWVLIVAALFVAAALTLGYDAIYGRLGFIGPQPVIVANGQTRIIRVPPGGNVQAAIEKAESGDIVELQAGGVYSGTINLPNKPLTGYVTIQSSGAADLPVDKRVTPAQRSSMATIVAGILGRPAVSAAKGANHYRFIGIEFTASSAAYNYGLIVFGGSESAASRVPHDLEIDRSYLHPYKTGVARRGIALNSAETTIKNSYIEGFGYPGEEAQGICGWTGTRGVHIVNNFIEGGAENIMIGGADPDSAELIPADIEIRGNHLDKRPEWFGKATVKTLFEIKNAKRVDFSGNLLTNNWSGSALRITVRNQDGGSPFSTIEDVAIHDNVISNAGEGINILGKDDSYPSQTLQRLTITNNLFLGIGGRGVEGSAYFVQVADGNTITISNNTVLNTGNIATLYGTLPTAFVFRDNITGHGNYGIHGPIDLKSDQARSMFQNNIFVNLNRVSSDGFAYPPGNAMLRDLGEVGFINPDAGDYRFAPNSKTRRGVGCDVSKLSPELLRAIQH